MISTSLTTNNSAHDQFQITEWLLLISMIFSIFPRQRTNIQRHSIINVRSVYYIKLISAFYLPCVCLNQTCLVFNAGSRKGITRKYWVYTKNIANYTEKRTWLDTIRYTSQRRQSTTTVNRKFRGGLLLFLEQSLLNPLTSVRMVYWKKKWYSAIR